MMRKFVLLFVSAFLFSFNNLAQITFTKSNTDFSPGISKSVIADTAGFTFPVIGVNQQWNYSNLVKKSIDSWTSIVPSNPNFPTATSADTNLSAVFIPSWYYHYDAYDQVSSDGFKYLGYSVKSQHYGITITGNSKDSCIFPEQFLVMGTPVFIMPFPATMGTSWHSRYRNLLNFQLTISSFGLNKTPCQKVTNTVNSDSVIAWGKLRVPTASGPSLAYDVLMEKRISIQTDSFYLAGNPAPTSLLTAFGVSQGQSLTSTRYFFWRENARYTLLMINCKSNDESKVSGVFYDETAEYDPNFGVPEITGSSDLQVYPNPASKKLFIRSNSKSVEYSVYSTSGMSVDSGTSENGIIDIHALPAGLYFIKLKTATKTGTAKFVKN